MIYRLILPEWARIENPAISGVVEGEFDDDRIREYNKQNYNIYYLPNYPSKYDKNTIVAGSHIDKFSYVFVDMDLKSGIYINKDAFIEKLSELNLPPSKIVDSGNGIHVYWEVSDLDAISFLRIQRRLIRRLSTDEAVARIYQLMRVPGTFNTKTKGQPKKCEVIYASPTVYTCEHIDNKLPPITENDEQYCVNHYNNTYNVVVEDIKVDEKLPIKFSKLISSNKEVKDIWTSISDDRSKSDYRLGHIMFGNSFTRDEAMSVLVNTAKALARSPHYRARYAKNIVDKIWTYELENSSVQLSKTVREILESPASLASGTRFPCWRYIDATKHGFRLGQVIGLVAGSGVGKTSMALNMFLGFVKNNMNCVHFFIPLEQPANEIANRWKTMCAGRTDLYDKVHVLSNYDDDGSFRHLSFDEIKEYILKFQTTTNKKVGCVVIDHIGALKKKGKDGENQDLMTICHEMKAFAIQTNTLLIMQSQSSRDKAGIGDLELNKDAAYGTVYFESYCDYLITIWQPLKRCYSETGCLTVTSFKFCKIRHKNNDLDEIKEDVCHNLFFDTKTEHLRVLTQPEEESFRVWAAKSVNLRKKDRKTDLVTYKSITWGEDSVHVDSNKNDT